MQRLLDEYKESHENKTNQLIHWIFVPIIFLSVIGLLWDLKLGVELDFFGGEPLNLAMIAMLLVYAYYLSMSFSISLGMLIISALGLTACFILDGMLPMRIWLLSLVIFVVSWIFQIIGHKIEGKKPSFLKDIEFFLVGPMWVLTKLYNKLGVKY
ncbi:MAG: DUF962 domain-containing protein [Flavobacteriales bacterium]|nr:DUF962 domain-containing protein [Flavobacteriales bacterium]